MDGLNRLDQVRILVMILENGLENEEFLSKIADLYDCEQSQLKIVLKSVIYDYQKQINEVD